MLLKTIKYIIALITFTLSCHDIYFNNEQEIKKIEEVHYAENNTRDYFAYLKIPSIAVDRPIYHKDDVRNDIDKNIMLLSKSDTPLDKNGNVIIAGHNGTDAGYFKNLYKLEKGDYIYLEYQDQTYRYKVDNRYFIKKTGTAEMIRDNNTKSITLITCYGTNKQLIVVANIET